VWSEGGVEAGPLQRDVDELLVREAGAQSASSAAAAHCSSEVVRLGMREQGDGAFHFHPGKFALTLLLR